MSDFELAMCHIVPSTYRGLDGIVDVQSVKWEDIGGLGEVKLALQQVTLLIITVIAEFINVCDSKKPDERHRYGGQNPDILTQS